MKSSLSVFFVFWFIHGLLAQITSSNKDYAILEVRYGIEVQMNKNAALPPGTESVEELMENVESILMCSRTKGLFFTPHIFDKKNVAEAVASILLQANNRYFTDVITQERLIEQYRWRYIISRSRGTNSVEYYR